MTIKNAHRMRSKMNSSLLELLRHGSTELAEVLMWDRWQALKG